MVSLLDLKKGKFDYLTHNTNEKDALNVLKEGYLLIKTDQNKGKSILKTQKWSSVQYPGVYMSLAKVSRKKSFSEWFGKIQFIFSLNLLHDQSNFHMNAEIYNGFSEHTFFPDQYLEFSNFFNKQYQNEIIFHDPVSLKYLRLIVIDDDKVRNKFIRTLKSEGLNEFIPYIIYPEDIYARKKNSKIIDPPDLDSRDPLYKAPVKGDLCVPLSFIIGEYWFNRNLEIYINNISNLENKRFIINLVDRCEGTREELEKRKVNINKKKLSKSDIKIINSVITRKYIDYLDRKHPK